MSPKRLAEATLSLGQFGLVFHSIRSGMVTMVWAGSSGLATASPVINRGNAANMGASNKLRRSRMRSVMVGSIHQLAGEIRHFHRRGPRLFLEVGAGAVAAFDHLVIEIGRSHLGQPGREFARVLRSDPIIPGRRPDQSLRVFHP